MMRPLLKTGETRVWRTYHGGRLLDEWHGRQPEGSGQLPEDWAASTTQAINAGREDIIEGLSRVLNLEGEPYLRDVMLAEPEALLGEKHVQSFGPQPGYLVKLIDADERLGIQVHPDRAFAKAILNSDYGKTESWYILGNNGAEEEPVIYMGFKPGVTREKWQRLFETQDIAGMLESMHCIPVKPGDCFIVDGGVPHAIGRGCFLAELQEPTDYTMRCERVTVGGIHLTDRQCHYGTGFDSMLDCFHYDGCTMDEAMKRWKASPCIINETAEGVTESLIDERLTKMFTMCRVSVTGRYVLPAPGEMTILMALTGSGTVSADGDTLHLKQGEVACTSARCGEIVLTADEGSFELLHCFPPKP